MSGTLEVQGEGRANAVPDRIRLSFAVSGYAVGYRETVEQLNEKTDELRRLIEAGGADRERGEDRGFRDRGAVENGGESEQGEGGEDHRPGFRGIHGVPLPAARAEARQGAGQQAPFAHNLRGASGAISA